MLLLVTRSPLPGRRHLDRLLTASLCAFLIYPLTTSWALKSVPAAHSAIVTGILPLATALMGAWRAGERPTARFWICAGLGSALVLIFAAVSGGGSLHLADVVLLFVAISLAAGFTEGAILSRTYGGWRTICWMLVTLAPFVGVLLGWHGVRIPATATPGAWAGFAYVIGGQRVSGVYCMDNGAGERRYRARGATPTPATLPHPDDLLFRPARVTVAPDIFVRGGRGRLYRSGAKNLKHTNR